MSTNPIDPQDPQGGEDQAPQHPWARLEQEGLTPEQAEDLIEAYQMKRGLSNLDTRRQVLDQIIRPELDPYVPADQVQQFQEQLDDTEEMDPWEMLDEGGDFQEQGFDPRSLEPVLAQREEQLRQQMRQEIMGELGQMAQQQEIEQSATAAVQEAGLPPSDAPLIRQMVANLSSQYPNRQASDLAKEIAEQRKRELGEWAMNFGQGQREAPGGPAPQGGPTPSPFQPPKTFEEARKRSEEMLGPRPG